MTRKEINELLIYSVVVPAHKDASVRFPLLDLVGKAFIITSHPVFGLTPILGQHVEVLQVQDTPLSLAEHGEIKGHPHDVLVAWHLARQQIALNPYRGGKTCLDWLNNTKPFDRAQSRVQLWCGDVMNPSNDIKSPITKPAVTVVHHEQVHMYVCPGV